MIRALRSSGLALALCLAIALCAAAGTALPGRMPPRPLLAGLFALLVLNIAVCTGSRLLAARRSPSPQGLRRTLDALLHLSLVLALAGGTLKSLFGFVGTQYLFVGQAATTVRAGAGEGTETPLGFGLLLKERTEEHYPLVLRIGVRDARTGAKIALVTVREGRAAVVPGTGLRLDLLRHDPEAGLVTVEASGGDRVRELRLATAPGPGAQARLGDRLLEVVAWQRELRAVRGRVAVLEGGREVREAVLEVNGRIAHRGTAVYLTAWGEDEFGNRFLGVQASRDPGAPLFWAGASLLALAAPLFVLARRRLPSR